MPCIPKPTAADQFLYGKKVRIFLIAAGTSLIAIGTTALAVVLSLCEHQETNIASGACMMGIGVLGTLIALCVTKNGCGDKCWWTGPFNFQSLLTLGFLFGVIVVTTSDCMVNLPERKICHVEVDLWCRPCPPATANRTLVCTDCLTADCTCCAVETSSVLTAVYGVVTVINVVLALKYLCSNTNRSGDENAPAAVPANQEVVTVSEGTLANEDQDANESRRELAIRRQWEAALEETIVDRSSPISSLRGASESGVDPPSPFHSPPSYKEIFGVEEG